MLEDANCHWEPADVLCSVFKFPAVPLTVNVATVCLEPATKLTVWGGVSTLKSLKAFDPETVYDPVPLPVNRRLQYESPPPANVLGEDPESVYLMVDVPATNLPPAAFHRDPPDPLRVTVFDPAERVPLVRMTDEQVRSSWRVHPPPVPLKFTAELMELKLVVIVLPSLVEAMVRGPT